MSYQFDPSCHVASVSQSPQDTLLSCQASSCGNPCAQQILHMGYNSPNLGRFLPSGNTPYIHITFVPQELFIHRRHIIMATLGTIMTIFITLTLCALKLSLPTYCTVWYSQRYTLSLLHIIRPYLRCLLQVLLVWDIILILLIRSIGRCPPLIVSHIHPLCLRSRHSSAGTLGTQLRICMGGLVVCPRLLAQPSFSAPYVTLRTSYGQTSGGAFFCTSTG
jgi:hypothetical protein